MADAFREMPLALGTAQLGMDYGISNQSGQPDPDTAAAIVSAAWREGIHRFDTAQAYGRSERVLGESLRRLGVAEEARVVTKLSPVAVDGGEHALRESVRQSVANLHVPMLHGLLLHHEGQWAQWNDGLGSALMDIKQAGTAQRIGVSVYSPEVALEALRDDRVDLIQVPANAFDHRMMTRGVFDVARKNGKEVWVRSVFLQGLLLMAPDEVPDAIPGARKAVAQLNEFCAAHDVRRAWFALFYARTRYQNSPLVIGAEAPRQIEENCALVSAADGGAELCDLWDEQWEGETEVLVNPSLWNPR
ncbi:MAG: aldo/keto reductase [Verrucomicrobia bacterium]|nr:aldo/keto reductase [Verrucomicrobiota bacterium]